MMGLKLSPSQIIKLLRRTRFDVGRTNSKTLTVIIPCYRLDILHPYDVMEDIAIAYGLNQIQPKWPSDLTIGGISPLETYSDRIRGLMIGFGFQEVLTFMMTNQEKLFSKMNKPETGLVEISNPKVITLRCLRPELLPSLLEFLSNNTHVQYPQNLFEVGDCTIWGDQQPTDRPETMLRISTRTRQLHRDEIRPGTSDAQPRIQLHPEDDQQPQLPRRPDWNHLSPRERRGNNRGDPSASNRELETRAPSDRNGIGPDQTIHDTQEGERWRGTIAAHLRENQLSRAKPFHEVCVLVLWATGDR